jgi:hypothetical protein
MKTSGTEKLFRIKRKRWLRNDILETDKIFIKKGPYEEAMRYITPLSPDKIDQFWFEDYPLHWWRLSDWVVFRKKHLYIKRAKIKAGIIAIIFFLLGYVATIICDWSIREEIIHFLNYLSQSALTGI